MDFKFLRQLSGTLYSAVVMELFERLAYYGMVMVLGIYIVDHLGVPADTYGWVYGIFTGSLYFLPVLAGALADRFGYKPALTVAFATLAGGYFLLGTSTNFTVICLALGLIAVGGSIIKPTISGTVTRTTEEGSTRPVGFGLYYTMINAGGLIGPVIAAQVRNRTEFHYVFWVSASACVLMLLQAIFAFREPVKTSEISDPVTKKLREIIEIGYSWLFVFVHVLTGSRESSASIRRTILFILLFPWSLFFPSLWRNDRDDNRDLTSFRFLLLLVVFSGFWGMINVLFGFMPLYVETFTDLRAAEAAIDSIIPISTWAGNWLNPEVLISLDALLIVLFQATISYLTRRWPTLRAMLVGTTIAVASWILPALSPTAVLISLGIVVWSLGEMICSARFFEYCGTIAPKDQVALYLGYSFFAIFIGNFYSGPWAGWLYERFIRAPHEAGAPTQPWLFFSGVMLMGLFSVVGLAIYGWFINPDAARRGEPAQEES